jgi:hypothetical protein
VNHPNICTLYEVDEADGQQLFWLERCYSERVGMVFVKVDPLFESLHVDPRFADLIKRIGFLNKPTETF